MCVLFHRLCGIAITISVAIVVAATRLAALLLALRLSLGTRKNRGGKAVRGKAIRMKAKHICKSGQHR